LLWKRRVKVEEKTASKSVDGQVSLGAKHMKFLSPDICFKLKEHGFSQDIGFLKWWRRAGEKARLTFLGKPDGGIDPNTPVATDEEFASCPNAEELMLVFPPNTFVRRTENGYEVSIFDGDVDDKTLSVIITTKELWHEGKTLSEALANCFLSRATIKPADTP
jgi:hypothetical protein